jgi:hypothetical protein
VHFYQLGPEQEGVVRYFEREIASQVRPLG